MHAWRGTAGPAAQAL
jgi:very-short-patch-repair endonuclease